VSGLTLPADTSGQVMCSVGQRSSQSDYQLTNGTKSYLHYNKFAIGSAEDQY